MSKANNPYRAQKEIDDCWNHLFESCIVLNDNFIYFYNSDESQEYFHDSMEEKIIDVNQKYGTSISNNAYTEALYENVLQRIPDKEGLLFWQDSLNTGRLDRDILLIEFSNSNENISLTAANIDNGYWLLA